MILAQMGALESKEQVQVSCKLLNSIYVCHMVIRSN